ncbi:MAG TPA: hypothetical protein VEA99_01050 [Gemmatimonadaceae bacterium]|nr:hypothetical protein [Gemmatimonadaceae bacterium]
MSRRPLIAALVLVLTASVAGAQQAEPARFQRSADGQVVQQASVHAADSVVRYAALSRVQRRTGASLFVAALATTAAAYVQYARSDRMGMQGGQLSMLAAGGLLGAVGVSRWTAARESGATATRWQQLHQPRVDGSR